VTTISCLRLAGKREDVIDLYTRFSATPTVRRLSNADIASSLLVNHGLALLELGESESRFREARSLLERGLELVDTFKRNYAGNNSDAKTVGSAIWKARILNNLGWCSALAGDHPTAIRFYEESLALKVAFSEEVGIAQTHVNICVSSLSLKNYAQAVSSLKIASEIMDKTPDKYICREVLYESIRVVFGPDAGLNESHTASRGAKIAEGVWNFCEQNAARQEQPERAHLLNVLGELKKFELFLRRIDGFS